MSEASKTSEPVMVDARGLRCPMPVLRLRKVALQHPPGTVVRLRADDPAAERDVPAFAAEMGWACARLGHEWQVVRPA